MTTGNPQVTAPAPTTPAPAPPACTTVFPPLAAVRMAWAMTGAFASSEPSQKSAGRAEQVMKDIQQVVAAGSNDKEKSYVLNTTALMESAIRSLDTIYKGRNLNFEENEKLRSAYLENSKSHIEFGNRIRDFFKSLPSMTISSAGGLTIAQIFEIPQRVYVPLGFFLAGIGYVANLLILKAVRAHNQKLYLKEDFDRDVYYEQYVNRVASTLTSLYRDVDRLHANVFGNPYPTKRVAAEIVDECLHGIRPTLCPHVIAHMRGNVITPQLWPLCESGGEVAERKCQLWPKNPQALSA